MHVLGADMMGVSALENIEHLAERAEFETERAAEKNRPVIIRLLKP